MDQAVASSQMDSSSNKTKVPVVFLKEKQKKLKDTLVIMRLDDLLKSIFIVSSLIVTSA